MSTGEKIAQIEGLVISIATQELVLTKEQTEEIMVNSVSIRLLEENIVVYITP